YDLKEPITEFNCYQKLIQKQKKCTKQRKKGGWNGNLPKTGRQMASNSPQKERSKNKNISHKSPSVRMGKQNRSGNNGKFISRSG
ncbi:hypothetical protein, partial [Histophilus somni]